MPRILPDPTHVGWFGFCPVKIAFNRDGDPVLMEHWALTPVMWASLLLQTFMIHVTSMLLPGEPPSWIIAVTGQAKLSKRQEYAVLRSNIYEAIHKDDEAATDDFIDQLNKLWAGMSEGERDRVDDIRWGRQ